MNLIFISIFFIITNSCPIGEEEHSFLFKKWCSPCKEGYYSEEGWKECKKCVEGCSECQSPSGKCLSCKEGYEYNKEESKCSICPSGTYNEYRSKTSCKECNKREYSPKGSERCFPVDTSCVTYNKTNGNCLSCYEGYELKNNKCNKCKAGMYSNSKTNKKCVECEEGYYSFPGWKMCINCDVGCTSCDKTSGKCFSCYEGYELNNGKCEECPKGTYNDINSTTKCKQCPERTYSREGWGKCVTCGSICMICDKTNGNCLQCNDGYQLNTNNKCEKCPAGTFSNRTSGNKCVECPNGSYAFEGSSECIPCDIHCSNCIKTNGKCIELFDEDLSPKGICNEQNNYCQEN